MRRINTLNSTITSRHHLYYFGDNRKRTLSNNNSRYSVGPEFQLLIDHARSLASRPRQLKPSHTGSPLRTFTIKRSLLFIQRLHLRPNNGPHKISRVLLSIWPSAVLRR